MQQHPVTEAKLGKIIRRILRYISPKVFDAGLEECNQIALSLLEPGSGHLLLDLGCGGGGADGIIC